MAENRTFTALLKLMAKIDGSFSSSMRKAVSDLQKVDAATQKLGKSNHFSALAKSADKNFSHVEHRAERMSEKIKESFQRIGEYATGELLAHGIENAFDKVIEFTKSGFEVRAEREVLQNQLHAVLGSQGRSYLQPGIDLMIRKFSDNEAAVKYEPAMEVANQLLAASPGKFKSSEDIHTKLLQLANLSRDENTFKLAAQAYTRVLANGKLDAQHLNELSIDTGMPIRKFLAQALNMNVEQLGEAIKKHKITGAQGISALDKALALISAPGGPGYEHAASQMTGLKGLTVRFEERWRDFEESFGRAIEDFISPLSERILKAIGPSELLHAFDAVDKYAKAFGQAIGHLADVFASTGITAKFQALGAQIGGIINKRMFGGFDPSSMYSTFTNPATGSIETVLNAKGQAWMDKFDRLAVLAGKAADGLAKVANFVDTHWTKIFGTFKENINDVKLIYHTLTGDFGAAGGDLHNIMKESRDKEFLETVPQRAQQIKEEFEKSGKSADDIQTKLATLPVIGAQFTGQLSHSFDVLAAKLAAIANGATVADQVIRGLRGAPNTNPLTPPSTIAKPTSSTDSERNRNVVFNQSLHFHGDVSDHRGFVERVRQATREILDDQHRRAYA